MRNDVRPLGAEAVGELAPAGCVHDNDSRVGDCAQNVNGLDLAASVAVSPDGKSVYATSVSDNAIVRFNRSATGALTSAGCIVDDDGPDVCAQEVVGLSNARRVVVSGDGGSVYVAASGSSDIARFNRISTGAITLGGCIEDTDTGLGDCASTTSGLDGAFGVDVRADGRSVYVASFFDHALVHFNRAA